jgi:hypothetical protein
MQNKGKIIVLYILIHFKRHTHTTKSPGLEYVWTYLHAPVHLRGADTPFRL